jgi:lipid-A-disaccharide synthase
VVKELIQNDLTPEKISLELKKILSNPQKKEKMQQDYAELKQLLSEGGNASENAARSIYHFLIS